MNFKTEEDTFYEDHYNGIRIVYRGKDGYINATNLCADFDNNSKPFYNFLKLDRWKEIQTNFYNVILGLWISTSLNNPENLIHIPAIYEIKKGKRFNVINRSYILADDLKTLCEENGLGAHYQSIITPKMKKFEWDRAWKPVMS